MIDRHWRKNKNEIYIFYSPIKTKYYFKIDGL